MSNQIKVDKDLTFSNANHSANVKGPMQPRMCMIWDDFTGKAVNGTNDYTVTVGGTNDSIEVTGSSDAGGWLNVLSGDTDNEGCLIATNLIFLCSQEPMCECQVKLSDVSQTAIFFGFSDATTEANVLPISYLNGTLTPTADDAAGILIDADKGTSSVYGASDIAGGGTGQSSDLGFDAVDNTWYTLRVELDTSGNATFYAYASSKSIEEAYTAKITTAITTTDYLCMIFAAATRDNGGGDSVYVDYWGAWQNRLTS